MGFTLLLELEVRSLGNSELRNQWLTQFPPLATLDSADLEQLQAAIQFKQLKKGDIAYQPGWSCDAFLMCLQGQTRIFKRSESGREILLYRVEAGQTCVLTTSCLLAGTPFPAESIAEQDTSLAALPVSVFRHLMEESVSFRHFVFNNYGDLLANLIVLVDEVAFSSIDIRLARALLKVADSDGIVHKTHQQLAQDLGSVREVISRHLREWERETLIKVTRGKIRILNRAALNDYSMSD
jgi:CRP/FNR family transcriptional regulator